MRGVGCCSRARVAFLAFGWRVGPCPFEGQQVLCFAQVSVGSVAVFFD